MAMANDAVAAAANDADVIASILSQLPIDHYDRVRSVSQLWNDGVRASFSRGRTPTSWASTLGWSQTSTSGRLTAAARRSHRND